jgi:protein transport protein SEC31
MVRLREINTKSQFAFSPLSTCIAAATAAGSLSDDLSDEAKLELYDLDLDADDFVLRPKVSLSIPDRCRSIAWGGVVAGFSQGVIAVAMESSVDIYDAQALMYEYVAHH